MKKTLNVNRVEFTADKPFQHFTVELIVESSLAQVNKSARRVGDPCRMPCRVWKQVWLEAHRVRAQRRG